MLFNPYAVARPETKARIEVVSNPVSIAATTYKAWLDNTRDIYDVFEERPANNRKNHDQDKCDVLYGKAEKMLREASRLSGMNSEQFARAEKLIVPHRKDYITDGGYFDFHGKAGLFLSALINASNLNRLSGLFNHTILGYRLAEGKTLIAEQGSDVTCLAPYARGTIVNMGSAITMAEESEDATVMNFDPEGREDGTNVNDMSPRSSGGVHVNFGKILSVGEEAEGSVIINFWDAGSLGPNSRNSVVLNIQQTGDIAHNANGGVHVNLLYAGQIGEKSEGSVLANYGFPCSVADEAVDGSYFNSGRVFCRTKKELEEQKKHKPTTEDAVRALLVGTKPYFDEPRDTKLSELFGRLEGRLVDAEFDRAGTGRKHFFYLSDPETAIKLVTEYDWKKIRKDVNTIAEQIKEAAA